MVDKVRVTRRIVIKQNYELPIEGEDNAYPSMTPSQIVKYECNLTFADIVESGGFWDEEMKGAIEIETEVALVPDVSNEPDPDKDYDLTKEQALICGGDSGPVAYWENRDGKFSD
jgi:hypothetical protein